MVIKSSLLYNLIRQRASYLARMSGEVPLRLLLAVPFVPIILLTGLSFRFVGDEGLFHIKAINAFASSWPIPNIADYSSASTPLPYLLWTIYGKIVGFEIWKLRILSVVVTYLMVNLFYNLCKQHKLPYPLLSTLILLFFPYVFFHGFTIYTVSFGLFFGVWALHYYFLDEPNLIQLFKGSLLATLAIYCRQYYLVLPAGMLFFELWRTNWRSFVPAIRQRFWRLTILSLPIVLVLPLFWLWQGFTPPLHQTDHFVHPILQHLNFMPIFVGFYFLPILFSKNAIKMLRFKKVALLVVAILLPIYFLFPLVYSEEPNRIAAMTGVIAHTLDILSQIIGSPGGVAAKLGLWTAGLLIIFGEIINCPWSVVKSKLFALLATFLILISLTPYVSERYYILIIPYLILILHRSFRNSRLLYFWLILQIAISVGFSYWQIVLKSFNI